MTLREPRSTQPSRTFTFDDFELDESRFELRRGGRPVALRPTPMRLLIYLMEHRGSVLSKDDVLSAVWKEVAVNETSLSTALKDLRQALDDDGTNQRYIQTRRGRGYCFVPEVKVRATGAAPRPQRTIFGRYRNPSMSFVGRRPEIDHLGRLLTEPSQLSVSVSIEGLAGIGKTELAVQLIHHVAAHACFPGGIYWLDAEAVDLTPAWSSVIADHLDLPVGSAQQRCRQTILGIERANMPVLIVLDNVLGWSSGTRPAPLPAGPHIRFLATTRERKLGGSRFIHLELGALGAPFAREFLSLVSQREFGAEAEDLLAHLAGHALAIELAAGFLGTYEAEQPASYLHQLEQQGEELEAALVDLGKSDRTVAQAFRSIWERLPQAAREAWWLASFFDPQPMSIAESIEWGMPAEGIRRLEELHVLQTDATGCWTMHRLARGFAEAAFPVEPRALDLLITLGPRLVHRKYSARELRRVYGRAMTLAETLGRQDQLFTALSGLLVSVRLQGDWAVSIETAQRMHQLASAASNPTWSMLALHGSAEAAFYTGKVETACEHFLEALELCGSIPRTSETSVMQPVVSLFAYAGLALCVHGDVDSGLAHSNQSMALAAEIGQPHDRVIAAIFKGTVHLWRGEIDDVEEQGRRIVEICQEHDFPQLRIVGERHIARAVLSKTPELEQGEIVEGCQRELTRIGLKSGLTLGMALVAESWAILGESERGMPWIEDAIRTIEITGERFFEAELWRIRAALETSTSSKIECLQRAIQVSETQGARWWQLRAACDLTELEATLGIDGDGRARLQRSLSGISEGATLRDVRRAQQLLE